MSFPEFISFTLTNQCNLRCRMCGQWSRHGYMHNRKTSSTEMCLADWKRVVDEMADHKITSVLLRGGEPFLYPGIGELLEYINSKGIFISIDTNGTMLEKWAADIVRLGQVHLTISIDGPEVIHDRVRGIKGSFRRTKQGILKLMDAEKSAGKKISRSICFTLSRYSYKGLAALPDTARSLFIKTITVVPYYFIPPKTGKKYEQILKEKFQCAAFSWHGFQHRSSGINLTRLRHIYREYKNRQAGLYEYPYLPLTEAEYCTWFKDTVTPVKFTHCNSVERLLDIQPRGEANFCVDFPDYTIGNVKDAAIESLWNNSKAEAFRAYRRKQPLPVCYRCGAKYMAETRDQHGNLL